MDRFILLRLSNIIDYLSNLLLNKGPWIIVDCYHFLQLLHEGSRFIIDPLSRDF